MKSFILDTKYSIVHSTTNPYIKISNFLYLHRIFFSNITYKYELKNDNNALIGTSYTCICMYVIFIS